MKAMAMEQVAIILIVLIVMVSVIIFFMSQFTNLQSGFGSSTSVAQEGGEQLEQEGSEFWNSLTGSCTGTATSCNTFSSQSDCNNQDGCVWDGSQCTGTSTSCSNYNNKNACENQDGCVWS